MWEVLATAAASSVLSGAFFAAVIGVASKRRTEMVAAQVKREFEESFLHFRSGRDATSAERMRLQAP